MEPPNPGQSLPVVVTLTMHTRIAWVDPKVSPSLAMKSWPLPPLSIGLRWTEVPQQPAGNLIVRWPPVPNAGSTAPASVSAVNRS